jgi:hypothetical protein
MQAPNVKQKRIVQNDFRVLHVAVREAKRGLCVSCLSAMCKTFHQKMQGRIRAAKSVSPVPVAPFSPCLLLPSAQVAPSDCLLLIEVTPTKEEVIDSVISTNSHPPTPLSTSPKSNHDPFVYLSNLTQCLSP